MDQVEVVRATALARGAATRGILRETAFESEETLVSKSTVSPGSVSEWHHHGKRNLHGFVVSGRLRFEYGATGGETVEVSAGDFFHIPVGLVHRDVNPDESVPAVVVAFLSGKGLAVVNVESP